MKLFLFIAVAFSIVSCGPKFSVTKISEKTGRVEYLSKKETKKLKKTEYAPLKGDTIALCIQTLFVFSSGRDTSFLRSVSASFFKTVNQFTKDLANPYFPNIIVPQTDSTGIFLFPNYKKITGPLGYKILCKYNLSTGRIILLEYDTCQPKFKPAQF